MKKYFIIAIAVLLGSVFSLWKLYQFEHEERVRTESNQNSLLTGIEHYKTSDSLNAVKIQQLELSKKEMKAHEEELIERAKSLEIKLRNLTSVTSVSTETEIQFVPVVKDSFIYLPGEDSVIYMDCMEYRDEWIDFTACKIPEPNVNLVVKDSLDIFGSIVRRKFLFIGFGVKAVEADIVSYNPYTNIKYAKTIKLRKRNKK